MHTNQNRIMLIGFILLIVIVSIYSIFLCLGRCGERIQNRKNNKYYHDEEYYYRDYSAEEIAQIDGGVWRGLSMEQRVQLLNTYVEMEGIVLGIPYPIDVSLADLPPEIDSKYIHENRTILMNRSYMENAESYSVLNSMLHSLAHAAQYCAIDAYDSLIQCAPQYVYLTYFADIRAYHEDFDFITGADDLENHQELSLEIDADTFADQEEQLIRESVSQYLGN